MLTDLITQTKQKMEKSLQALKQDLGKLRTGRASLSVLDGIKVNYYGQPTPLNQVATMAVPEPRLITIAPWEANIIPEIEKSILNANIGLTPTSDGKIVRLSIPQLTEDRRKEIVKQLKSVCEESRVAIRQIRRNSNEEIKKLEKDKKIPEDQVKKAETDVQKITDDMIKQVDVIMADKEKDIMKV